MFKMAKAPMEKRIKEGTGQTVVSISASRNQFCSCGTENPRTLFTTELLLSFIYFRLPAPQGPRGKPAVIPLRLEQLSKPKQTHPAFQSDRQVRSAEAAAQTGETNISSVKI